MVQLSRRNLIGAASGSAAVICFPAIGLVPQSVGESGFVPIGGIDQWLAIRRCDRSGPAILFLHRIRGEAQRSEKAKGC